MKQSKQFLWFLLKKSKTFGYILLNRYFLEFSDLAILLNCWKNNKVIMKADVIPKVIMWPKSITGLMPLTIKIQRQRL